MKTKYDRLSKTQKEMLARMNPGETYDRIKLGGQYATLQVLHELGFVEYKGAGQYVRR